MDASGSPFRESLDEGLDQIRSTVRRLARNGPEQDDLFQECCVRIIVKEGSWKDRGVPFVRWLARVAYRTALGARRREARRARREVSIGEMDPAAPCQDKDVITDEQVRRVMARFVRLSARQRTILQMKYFQGRRTGDIALELGMSPSAVANEVNRSLARLRHPGAPAWLSAFLSMEWLGKESVAAPSGGAALGGITMKAKVAAVMAVAGIAGSGVLGYQCRQLSSRLDGQERQAESLERENGRLRDTLTAAEGTARTLARERESLLVRLTEANRGIPQERKPPEGKGGAFPAADRGPSSSVSPGRAKILEAATGLAEAIRGLTELKGKPDADVRQWEQVTLPALLTHAKLLRDQDGLIEGELYAETLAAMLDGVLPRDARLSDEQRSEVERIALEREERRQRTGLPKRPILDFAQGIVGMPSGQRGEAALPPWKKQAIEDLDQEFKRRLEGVLTPEQQERVMGLAIPSALTISVK